MKIKILSTLITVFTVFCLSSCDKSKEKNAVEVANNSEYYCPMKCEDEKTYKIKETKCPKCGMDLVLKE